MLRCTLVVILCQAINLLFIRVVFPLFGRGDPVIAILLIVAAGAVGGLLVQKMMTVTRRRGCVVSAAVLICTIVILPGLLAFLVTPGPK